MTGAGPGAERVRPVDPRRVEAVLAHARALLRHAARPTRLDERGWPDAGELDLDATIERPRPWLPEDVRVVHSLPRDVDLVAVLDLSTSTLHDALQRHLALGNETQPQPVFMPSIEAALRDRYAGQRILLVEDEPINQMVAREMLEEVGMLVDSAGDGEEALGLAGQTAYAIVLMDLQMPKLGGLDAARLLRLLPNGSEVPIVAMTANAFNEDRENCLAAGMNDFLPKPVTPDLLYGVLLKWLGRMAVK